MTSVTSQTIETPNGPHLVRTAGRGPELLVLPGGPGWGAEYLLESVTRLLGDRHRLIFVDQRGTGSSPVGTGPLMADAYVADVAAIADQLGLGSFDILGHSFGGLQALLFAIAHPERIDRMVLVEADAPRRALWEKLSEPGSPWAQRTLAADTATVAAITAEPDWMSDQDLVDSYLVAAYRPMYVDPAIAEQIRHGMNGARLTQMESTTKAVRTSLGAWDLTADLPALTVPTLLVFCHQSIFGPEGAEELHSLLPDSDLVWVAGGHAPFIEDPDAFGAVVEAFFAD